MGVPKRLCQLSDRIALIFVVGMETGPRDAAQIMIGVFENGQILIPRRRKFIRLTFPMIALALGTLILCTGNIDHRAGYRVPGSVPQTLLVTALGTYQSSGLHPGDVVPGGALARNINGRAG